MGKEEIIALLCNKFVGINTPIFARIADKIYKNYSNEEEVTKAIEELTINKIIESYADSRTTEAVKTAISNYAKAKKEQEKSDANANEKENKQNKGDNLNDKQGESQSSQWLTDLNKQISELTNKLKTIETAKVTETRQNQLREILTDLPIQLQKPYEMVHLEKMNDEEFNNFITTAKADVEGIMSAMKGGDVVFGKPLNNQGATTIEKVTKEEVADIVANY